MSNERKLIQSSATSYVEIENVDNDQFVTVQTSQFSAHLETALSESVSDGENNGIDLNASAPSLSTTNVDLACNSVDCVTTETNSVAGNSALNNSVVNSNISLMNTQSGDINVPGLNVEAPSFAPGGQWTQEQHHKQVQPAEVICNVAQSCPMDGDAFFQAEALGTVIEPKCGGCKCTKCPVPGSRYSFLEQRQFDKINRNMFYDKKRKCWFTKYPWRCERSVLP